MEEKNKRQSGKLLFGLILVAIGVLLLLDNMRILYIDDLFDIYWPVLMIVPGIWFIIKRPPSIIAGTTLLFFGIYYQLKELDIIYYPYNRIAFPLFLIFLGSIMIIYSKFFQRKFLHQTDSTEAENH